MLVQTQGFAERVAGVLEPEDLCAWLVERAVRDEIVDVPSRHEIGIQLDQRRGPETAAGLGCIDSLADVIRPDGREAPGEALVVRDEFIAEREDVHQESSRRSDRTHRTGAHKTSREKAAAWNWSVNVMCHLAESNSRLPLAIGSGSVDCSFGNSKLIRDPSEVRGLAQDHARHGPVIPFDHRAQFRMRNQSHPSGNGFFEPLPGLPERDQVVVPNRVQQMGVDHGRTADFRRRYHCNIVVVTGNAVLVSRQAPGASRYPQCSPCRISSFSQ